MGGAAARVGREGVDWPSALLDPAPKPSFRSAASAALGSEFLLWDRVSFLLGVSSSLPLLPAAAACPPEDLPFFAPAPSLVAFLAPSWPPEEEDLSFFRGAGLLGLDPLTPAAAAGAPSSLGGSPSLAPPPPALALALAFATLAFSAGPACPASLSCLGVPADASPPLPLGVPAAVAVVVAVVVVLDFFFSSLLSFLFLSCSNLFSLFSFSCCSLLAWLCDLCCFFFCCASCFCLAASASLAASLARRDALCSPTNAKRFVPSILGSKPAAAQMASHMPLARRLALTTASRGIRLSSSKSRPKSWA